MIASVPSDAPDTKMGVDKQCCASRHQPGGSQVLSWAGTIGLNEKPNCCLG